MVRVFRGTISIGVIFIGQGVGDKVKYRTSPMSVADSRARAKVRRAYTRLRDSKREGADFTSLAAASKVTKEI